MLLPIRTDYRMTRLPLVNYALLAANVLLFVAGYHGANVQGLVRIEPYMLDHQHPLLYQFFTSMFLHASVMHLFGNMLFLWVFGNAINDRLGNVGYLAFYLAGGVFAALGYQLTTPYAPVLGASGAISAVTGAYLVMLPRVRVTLLFFFWFITTFEVSSLFFLLIQLVFNMVGSVDVMTSSGGGGVAYSAHLAGYVYGIAVAAALLATNLLPRDVYDLLNLLRAWYRRTRYRRMVAQGNDPFNYVSVAREEPPRKRMRAKTVKSPEADALAQREDRLRREIAEAWRAHDLSRASELYLQLVQIAEEPILERQQQLDVANQLMADSRYPAAADAYERYLRRHPKKEDAADIRLMLGLLYGRYLHQYDRAEENLRQAIESLHDERKQQMAHDELQTVRSKRS